MTEYNVPGRLGDRLTECGAVLQVALDVTSIGKALNIGYYSLVSPAVILEAGTPLIKAEGLRVASLLKGLPQEPVVVADMKIFDTGGLEAGLAASHGFDATTVLALAPRETIVEAVEAAEKNGVALYGDLIGHPDPLKGAAMLRELGVHIALLHIGIDVQRKLGLTAGKMADFIGGIKEAFKGPVAVAGGIKPEETSRLARAGADIIIIGSGITKSSDPRSAAVEAVRGLRPRCL